jgi:hypothetical protein
MRATFLPFRLEIYYVKQVGTSNKEFFNNYSKYSQAATGEDMKFFARAIWAFLVTLLPAAGLAGTDLTLQEAENRLIRGGYLETLHNAPWAAAQGGAMVPLLSQMLQKSQAYDRELGGATGAFPFNVLWALAHIRQPGALQVLEKYSAASRDPNATLALQGWHLRADMKNPRCGVLINDAPLLAQPSETALVLKNLKSGQTVKIEQEKIAAPGEEGPRGGPAHYDRVELIPGGEKGYIQRRGDDFSPFM